MVFTQIEGIFLFYGCKWEKMKRVNTVSHNMMRIFINKLFSVQRTADGDILKTKADVIIGADGAFSTVRKEFLKQPMFNYSQHYIEHAYIELHISSGSDGQVSISLFCLRLIL